MPTKHLQIKGRVQGVFYRASAKETAAKTGVTGWIKNTPQGEVEAVVSGTDTQLTDFIEWCKTGPSKAVVTDVVVSDLDETSFSGFSIVRR